MDASSQITINDNGSLTLMGEWNTLIDGTTVGRVIAPTYRENELKLICQREGFDCSLKTANSVFIAIITGVKTFDQFIDLVVEFRNHLG